MDAEKPFHQAVTVTHLHITQTESAQKTPYVRIAGVCLQYVTVIRLMQILMLCVPAALNALDANAYLRDATATPWPPIQMNSVQLIKHAKTVGAYQMAVSAIPIH